MAHRRRRSRKHRKGMSQNVPALSAGRRLRRRSHAAVSTRKRHRRGRGLGEIFSPVTASESARCTVTGLIGGMGAGVLNDIIPDKTGFGWRMGINLLSSFLVGGVLRAPKMAAGMAGATGVILYQKLRSGSLEEGGNHNYADPNVLAEYPMFADAQGNPMVLAEDGNMYYLDEDTVNAYQEALSQGGFMADDRSGEGIYPSYVNAANY